MKIGIFGTRGIPNHYGGFEQFATYFAQFLVQQGHQVTVYNSTNHPYKKKEWNGVNIQHCYDPEDKIGTVGQFIYDLNSILDARKKDYDILFQLGYTSSSIWSFLLPKSVKIITNMDGLEWKRTKYNKHIKSFLKKAEKWAVLRSDGLIADSIGIQKYIWQKYQRESTYIAYGAHIFENPKISRLAKYGLESNQFNLIIARLEPENNIEPVIKAHLKLNNKSLCIIGNHETKYGKYLTKKYNNRVRFMGGIYDIDLLNNLRYFSKMYFHGHSVGGTNPSLLEAMACGCLIVANDNEFNKTVLEDSAFYFKDENDILDLLKREDIFEKKNEYVIKNALKIQNNYSYEIIHTKLLNLINKTMSI